MTERQLDECLRLLTEAQMLIRGQNKAYNKISRAKVYLGREKRNKSK